VIAPGGQDRLADPLDVEFLREVLAPGVVVYYRRVPHYQHLDYDWGQDAHELIFPAIVRLLKQYAGQGQAARGSS
jgi:hypothetical protein